MWRWEMTLRLPTLPLTSSSSSTLLVSSLSSSLSAVATVRSVAAAAAGNRNAVWQCRQFASRLIVASDSTGGRSPSAQSLERGFGAGIYLESNVRRACRAGRTSDIEAVAKQFLVASSTLEAEECVFILTHLANVHRVPRFWHQAAEQLALRLGELTGDVVGLLANVFCRARVHSPDLMRAVAARLVQDQEEVPVRSLTLVLHASQRLGNHVENAPVQESITTHLSQRLPDMNSQDAALFFSSLGGPGGMPKAGRSALDSVKKQGLTGLATLPIPAVAQVVQAFARFAMREEKLFESLKPIIVARLHEFPPQSIGMVANGYARLGYLDEAFLSAIASSVSAALRTDIECLDATAAAAALDTHSTKNKAKGVHDHASVTQLLNAHAKVSVFHSDFFTAAMDWMTPNRLAKFSPQSISNGLHSLAKFPQLTENGRGECLQIRALFATFIPEIVMRVQSFNVQNLVNTVQAFSTLQIYDQQLFSAVVPELVARKRDWNTQDVANLASSLSRVECFDVDAFRTLARSVPALAARFRLDELVTTLNALAHSLRRPGSSADLLFGVQPALDPAEVPELLAFEAAAQCLVPSSLATGTEFEVALVLNSFAKVNLADSPVVDNAIAELENRTASGKRLTLAAVSLTLNALARLDRQPSAVLLRAFVAVGAAVRQEAASLLWKNLTAVRVVGLLNALVRLDETRGVAVLRPWVEILLRRLRELLEGRDVFQGAASFLGETSGDRGPHELRRSSSFGKEAWNSRSVPIALLAVSSMHFNCALSPRLATPLPHEPSLSSFSCAVCTGDGRKCIEMLLERLARLLGHEGGASRSVANSVMGRQARQALLAIYHLRCSPHCGKSARREQLHFARLLNTVLLRTVQRGAGFHGDDLAALIRTSDMHREVTDVTRAIVCAGPDAAVGQVSTEIIVLDVFSLDLLVVGWRPCAPPLPRR
eukprot:TRINITY_DN48183_c0_g1_i1.p1 TRINITY_DN48183_c0_g1~~TRINITY_DN48183_c0_g1_i1.p1  ORF type:complete len:943 (-),score=123.89 TRINITY_DN48183_c0_g1_i1:346-3174(-)